MAGLQYDPAINYQHTWRYYPGVVEGLLKYRTGGGVLVPPFKNCHGLRLDVTRPDMRLAAAAVMISAESVAWWVWPENWDDLIPGTQDEWEVEPGWDDAGRWIIQSVTRARWGAKWLIGTVFASNNG